MLRFTLYYRFYRCQFSRKPIFHAPCSPTCPESMCGGPARLMAAEVLSQPGLEIHLYDAMPSVARKFLLTSISGLNLTTSCGRG